MQQNAQLGCGLVALGRIWGYKQEAVVSDQEAQAFLESAYDLGIRFFDTAPAYGLSEIRLGRFLDSLTPNQQKSLTIATKFGEVWDHDSQSTHVDHTLEGLKKSLDQSLQLLGKIDLLQLHKTSPVVLASPALDQAWDYAKSLGIPQFGASISDLESGKLALEDPRLSYVQLPYNQDNSHFRDTITHSSTVGKKCLINRPFNMGKVMHQNQGAQPHKDAFKFILQQHFSGIILTGTTNTQHLRANIQAFNTAQKELS